MRLTASQTCYGCKGPLPAGASAVGAEVGDKWSYLCPPCWARVERGGRKPADTIEAILIFENDPQVGGPDDPLDHEDYRDLERLGLWSPRTMGDPNP